MKYILNTIIQDGLNGPQLLHTDWVNDRELGLGNANTLGEWGLDWEEMNTIFSIMELPVKYSKSLVNETVESYFSNDVNVTACQKKIPDAALARPAALKPDLSNLDELMLHAHQREANTDCKLLIKMYEGMTSPTSMMRTSADDIREFIKERDKEYKKKKPRQMNLYLWMKSVKGIGSRKSRRINY